MPFTLGGDWIPEKSTSPLPKHPVKVIKEKKSNVVITAVLNLPFDNQELKKLCSQLKQRLACGGTVKDGRIELQGEHVQAVQVFLKQMKEANRRLPPSS